MRSTAYPEPANFDCVADVYRWAEYLCLGPMLQRVRRHFIPALGECREALVLGDGDGRFLQQFLSSNASARVTAVDASRRMLLLLGRRCKNHADRLKFIHQSALNITPSQTTDLIVSHFFLDCLTGEQVSTLVQQIRAAVRPGTLWLISDFAIPRKGPLRIPAMLYIRLLYFAFRVTTGLKIKRLPQIEIHLRNSHFRCVACRTFLFGILYTELWELMSDDADHRTQPIAAVKSSTTLAAYRRGKTFST